MSIALEIEGVGKRYWQYHERTMLLNSLLPFRGARRAEHWALRHIDLSIEAGETVGFIGHNGAGKTTLLRLLAGVTRPTEGVVRSRGRIAPLISVGVGFHQEMSGRENVYVNGMLLGLTRRQIDQRLEEIVAFAELEEFVDTPVKFYSSGMFMRLGFAVAVHSDPDIFLVDEVLAVGDVAFQTKCFDRMRELQAGGTTLVVVSHALNVVRQLCPRVVLLDQGVLQADGPADDAIEEYLVRMTSKADRTVGDSGPVAMIQSPRVSDGHQVVHNATLDQPLVYEATIVFHDDVEDPVLSFDVLWENGTLIYKIHTVVAQEWRHMRPGERCDVTIPFVARLGDGTYQFCLTVFDCYSRQVLGIDTRVFLYLPGQPGSRGLTNLQASIAVDGTTLTDTRELSPGASPTDREVFLSANDISRSPDPDGAA